MVVLGCWLTLKAVTQAPLLQKLADAVVQQQLCSLAQHLKNSAEGLGQQACLQGQSCQTPAQAWGVSAWKAQAGQASHAGPHQAPPQRPAGYHHWPADARYSVFSATCGLIARGKTEVINYS